MEAASISNSQHYVWGNSCDGWHLLQRDDIRVIHERVPAGQSETRHFHNISRQFFYILAGTATMRIGDETVLLRQGEGLEVPPKPVAENARPAGTWIRFVK